MIASAASDRPSTDPQPPLVQRGFVSVFRHLHDLRATADA